MEIYDLIYVGWSAYVICDWTVTSRCLTQGLLDSQLTLGSVVRADNAQKSWSMTALRRFLTRGRTTAGEVKKVRYLPNSQVTTNIGNQLARSVDKYGRVLPNSYDQDNLRRFYSLENNGEDTSLKDLPPAVDYARGEVLLESSDEEGDEKSHTIESEGVMISEPGPSRFMDWQTEIDLNENDFADLDAQAVTYARHFLAEDEQQEVTRTRRLAVVNLDWD